MLDPSLSHLAVAGVLLLITTLAFLSQLTILHDLSLDARIFFNFLVALSYLTYYLAVTTPPGRVPENWTPISVEASALESGSLSSSTSPQSRTSTIINTTSQHTSTIIASPIRFCTPCNAFKPPRTHHCRICSTCIPKMDHHCPWLSNCIGYSNHPHFLRFLCAATSALGFLNFLLLGEWIAVYDAWDLPAYLFPHGAWEMGLLVGVSVVGGITGLVLFVLLCRTLGNAATGRTTIEAWEVERWEARRRRRGVGGGVYPLDVGVYENMKVAFGYRSVWVWAWPWAGAVKIGREVACFEGGGKVRAGCEWEGNGLGVAEWPPVEEGEEEEGGVVEGVDDDEGGWKGETGTPWMVEDVGDVEGFRRRQRWDWERRQAVGGWREGGGKEEGVAEGAAEGRRQSEKWRNSEGETLADYGVDDDEEEDVPLGVLMRRRRAAEVGGEGGRGKEA